MALENLLHESCLAGRSRVSESLQLYQILHPSASTSPSGTGRSRGATSGGIGGGAVVQCCDFFFESETVEFLLPNVPGLCRAEGTRRMREIRRSNTPL